MPRKDGPLTIAMIGAGGIARAHAKNLVKYGAAISGVCDIDVSRAQAFARDFDRSFATNDVAALLSRQKYDAAFVCTPNRYHATGAIAAFEAGCHVFLEKPMALTPAECRAINAAARQAKRHLQLGFYQRFYGESELLHELIEQGRFGQIYHARAVMVRRRGIPGWGSWFTTKREAGGGALMDIGVHIIDHVLWQMGHPQPASISGQTFGKFGASGRYVYTHMWGTKNAKGVFDVDDYAVALVRFRNGATLHIEAGWAANTEDACYGELLGDRGGARFVPGEPFTLLTEDAQRVADLRHQVPHVDPYEVEIQHFIECCRTNRKPCVGGADGLATQVLIDGIYRSSKAGREVRLGA